MWGKEKCASCAGLGQWVLGRGVLLQRTYDRRALKSLVGPIAILVDSVTNENFGTIFYDLIVQLTLLDQES